MYGRILVVASHPDDDVFGVGALLSAMKDIPQFTTKAIYLGNGVGSREDTPEGAVEQRLDAMEKANKIMGVDDWEVGLFEDQRFDAYPIIELTKWVAGHVESFKPDTIFTHSKTDLNRDHRLTFEAVMTACRPLPGSLVKYIYSFEVPSATDWGWDRFSPNAYFMGRFDLKQLAMEAYPMELCEPPHPRSVVGMWNLAAKRGGECGKLAAEAFEVVRITL